MKVLIYFVLIVFTACKANHDAAKVSESFPEIFTIGSETVLADEFIYIYKKNNVHNDDAFTRKDIDEYLDLYIKFKLKVAEAKSRGMDTTEAFKREFNTYLDQLKKPYLTETQVTQNLLTEAYNRYKQEVNAAHILIRLNPDASPGDTLKAYEQIVNIRQKALNGADFSALAKKYSDDPSAKENGGKLGYFTSFQMVYPFESAAYITKIGNISMPVRTKFGYHLIKVLDRRPTEGSVEVSHIMIRTRPDRTDSLEARNKIFDIYDQLAGGVSWNDLVRQFSTDMNTKNSGGKLRPFKVGQMPYSFQEAAFNLEQPGDISDPVLTPYGWHIIRLEQKFPLDSYEVMEPAIRSKILKDSRAELGKIAFIERLKKENGFVEVEKIAELLNVLDSVLHRTDMSGIAGNDIVSKILFRIADKDYTVADFFEFVDKQRLGKSGGKSALREHYNKFADVCIIAYEEAHLTDKYIDYRMLVKEYREGILLFELMEDEIWNKAVKDSTGLKAFYKSNLKAYQRGESVNAVVYRSDQEKILTDIERLVHSGDSASLSKKVLEKQFNNKTALTLQVEDGIFERGDNALVDQVSWTEGLHKISSNDSFAMIWIKEVLQEGPQPLNKVKGRVISDYQNYLESLWVDDLEAKFPVQIHEKGLNNIYEALEK